MRRIGADLLTAVGRGVAVVNLDAELAAEPVHQPFELFELVLFQGFERENIECVGLGVVEESAQHRGVIDQGFARGSGRGDGQVLVLENFFDAFGLVGIKCWNICNLENIADCGGQVRKVVDQALGT